MSRENCSNTIILTGCLYLFVCINTVVAQVDTGTIENPNLLHQEVTIIYEKGTIQDALEYLVRSYDINFSYVTDVIPLHKSVSINFYETRLDSVLAAIFKDTDVSFSLFQDIVLLTVKEDLRILEDSLSKLESKVLLRPLNVSRTERKNHLGEGKFVDKVRLLNHLRSIFGTSNTKYSKIKETRLDSLTIDSLSIEGSGRKIDSHSKSGNRSLFKNLSLQNMTVSYGFTANVASVLWLAPNKNIGARFDENSIPDVRAAFGIDLLLENNSFVTSLGLHVAHLNKTGIHRNELVNTVFPDNSIVNRNSYSEHFTYLEVPITLSFPIRKKKGLWLVQPRISLQRLISSKTSDLLRIYEIQYFTNLNANSSTNPDASPYFSNNFEPIMDSKAVVRRWNVLGEVSLKRIFNWKNQSFACGPFINYAFGTLFENHPALKEHQLQLGLGLQYSPVLNVIR